MHWTNYIAGLAVPTPAFPRYYCPRDEERYKGTFVNSKAGKITLVVFLSSLELALLVILVVAIVKSAMGKPTFSCCHKKTKPESVPLFGVTSE